MRNISNFLERFKNIGIPDETIRNELSAVIKEETGVEAGIHEITIKGDVAYIKCNGVEKSEIFQRKNKIVDRLRTIEGGEKIKDIR